ncbi:hypothetical protein HNQ57_002835 [Zhongshania antarctica]|uniref:Uncharacterized protein n=1 Tax=Zhongshania antarctica TaxID=641702 RepID=A0A840R5Q1_9GAMM|nr:hypothetical protein [Zhongshania antarctica]MBB5188545.1 hypothetical protein [Zhongshania antarctica]
MATPEDSPQVTAQVDSTRELCNTIQFMDALSQEGFGQIASIAELLKSAIEKGIEDNNLRPEDLYMSVCAIRGKAQDIENCINSEAESVGCNYVGKLSDIKRKKAFGLTAGVASNA